MWRIELLEFIETCPFLEEFAELFPVVHLDKLEEDVTAYCIESTPVNRF